MRNRGLGSWPLRRARMSPRRVALLHDDVPCTYTELNERVNRLARVLAGYGVAHGDRVAYLGPNHPAFVETLFATGALGATFVPLNTRLAAPELAYILADSGARLLVWDPRAASTVEALLSMVDGAQFVGREAMEAAMVAADPSPVDDEPVDEHETCMILYTSGTTGRPKGVMLTHANIAWNIAGTPNMKLTRCAAMSSRQAAGSNAETSTLRPPLRNVGSTVWFSAATWNIGALIRVTVSPVTSTQTSRL